MARHRWLLEHPVTHRWLRSQRVGNLYMFSKHELAREMVVDMKRMGIYSPTTVAVDICSSMRRTAAAVDPDEISPDELAYLEISRILEREGVSAPAVIARVCTYQTLRNACEAEKDYS
jgi:hypothetical protein